MWTHAGSHPSLILSFWPAILPTDFGIGVASRFPFTVGVWILDRQAHTYIGTHSDAAKCPTQSIEVGKYGQKSV